MARTRVLGVDRLKRKLAQIPKQSKPEIRKAIAKSAGEIVSFMRRLVPKDTMALHNSIGWTWGEAPEGSFVLGRTRNLDPDLTATIYAGNREAYYARWVEFGTVKTPSNPYFFPAFRANKKRSSNRIKRAITKAAKANA